MTHTPDDLSILTHAPRVVPPPTQPLSCYLLPEFWRGAAAAREAPEIVTTRIVAEVDQAVGRRTVRTQVVAHEAYSPTPEERRRAEEAAKDLAALERAAGKRDLAAMAAYHRWLSQSTAPEKAVEDEETT